MEHDFDPYEHLMRLHQRMNVVEQSIPNIAMAFNNRAEMLDKMAKNQEYLVDQLNRQDQVIQQLHTRLQLLEMARQHENNSPLSKLPRAER